MEWRHGHTCSSLVGNLSSENLACKYFKTDQLYVLARQSFVKTDGVNHHKQGGLKQQMYPLKVLKAKNLKSSCQQFFRGSEESLPHISSKFREPLTILRVLGFVHMPPEYLPPFLHDPVFCKYVFSISVAYKDTQRV